MRANSGLAQLPSGLWVPGEYAPRVPLSPAVRAAKRARALQANDSVLVTPGSGATVATHNPGDGKEYQVVMIAHESGHIWDTLPTYYFWSTYDAGAANEITMELFNATGSGVVVRLKKIFLHHNQAAITGVGHQFDVDSTSAVGTGGTAITGRKADSANAAIPAQVTCRHAPSGGATKVATLFSIAQNPEETLPSAAIAPMINWVPEGPSIQEPVIRENEGIRVIQITSNTAGVWGCLFVVTIE